MGRIGIVATILFASIAATACAGAKVSASKGKSYVWSNVTEKAQFPEGYNYPVFVMDGELRAINNGGWVSKDGKNWTKTALPESGLNSAYQKYVQFKDAIYALGTMEGNYLNMKLTSRISRTKDFKTWDVWAEKSNLPNRVFYGATVFKDKIWLFGGWDGKKYYNDAWSSVDGVSWERVAEKTAWSPRTPSVVTVFNNEIWLMGGGVIDGEKEENPNSEKEIWSSGDGLTWKRVDAHLKRKWRGAPVVFDNKLWLAGTNRGGTFASAVWVSDDGKTWQELSAPWSPRGGVAVWVFGGKLFLTGGKSSHTENGEIKFVYSNDVWAMEPKSE